MRKLTSLMLCIMMMLALVLSASALELDVAENDVTETEEAVLAADTLVFLLRTKTTVSLFLSRILNRKMLQTRAMLTWIQTICHLLL